MDPPTMNRPCAARVIAFVLLMPLAACHHGHAAALPLIDWHTSPLDLNLRGMNGSTYLFRCPPGKPLPASVTGSGVYTDASSICAAAVQVGTINPQHGGLVMIQILPGQNDYRGRIQNFILSEDYGHAWGGSFVVLSAADVRADRSP
jgi:hypothetical protein